MLLDVDLNWNVWQLEFVMYLLWEVEEVVQEGVLRREEELRLLGP